LTLIGLKGCFAGGIAGGTAFRAAQRFFLGQDRNFCLEMLSERTEAGWEMIPSSRQC
jgi:hypothetical protein